MMKAFHVLLLLIAFLVAIHGFPRPRDSSRRKNLFSWNIPMTPGHLPRDPDLNHFNTFSQRPYMDDNVDQVHDQNPTERPSSRSTIKPLTNKVLSEKNEFPPRSNLLSRMKRSLYDLNYQSYDSPFSDLTIYHAFSFDSSQQYESLCEFIYRYWESFRNSVEIQRFCEDMELLFDENYSTTPTIPGISIPQTTTTTPTPATTIPQTTTTIHTTSTTIPQTPTTMPTTAQ